MLLSSTKKIRLTICNIYAHLLSGSKILSPVPTCDGSLVVLGDICEGGNSFSTALTGMCDGNLHGTRILHEYAADFVFTSTEDLQNTIVRSVECLAVGTISEDRITLLIQST